MPADQTPAGPIPAAPKPVRLESDPARLLRLDGRRALVTGGAGGIGAATVRLLAGAGAQIDESNEVAHMPEEVARQALETVSGEFYLYNRAGEPAVHYGGNAVQFDPGSSGVHILDPDTLEHRPSYTPDLVRLIGLAALSAMLMTAWDLAVDPQMVMYGHWTWHVDGPFFGIPARNFVGWLATTLTVYLIYRSLEARWPPRGLWRQKERTFERLPLFIYGMLALGYPVGYSLLGRPELAVVAFFVMGTPCLIALLRVAPSTAAT